MRIKHSRCIYLDLKSKSGKFGEWKKGARGLVLEFGVLIYCFAPDEIKWQKTPDLKWHLVSRCVSRMELLATHEHKTGFAQVFKDLLKDLMRCEPWPKSKPKQGRNVFTSRNYKNQSCLQESLHHVQQDSTSERNSNSTPETPVLLVTEQNSISTYKSTEVASAPLSPNGKVL